MDDLGEIQRRINRIETELSELKALVNAAPCADGTVAVSPSAPAVPSAPAPSAPPAPSGPPKTAPFPARPATNRPAPPAAPRVGLTRGAVRVPLTQPRVNPGRSPQRPAAPARAGRSGEFEADMLGSWFARIGAFTLFLGAAFAFKYAVDRDLISPTMRIASGVLAGVALVGWGEWAKRKTWSTFAQAVAGGGVAIMYLSIWAGYQLYELMSSGIALILLATVVGVGGFLSIRHDSMALAVIATLGGFMNPLLVTTGRGSVVGLSVYLLLLNAGVLGLALLRKWRGLTVLSMLATWFLLSLSLATSTDTERLWGLAFAVTFFLVFHAALLIRYRTFSQPILPDDLMWTGLNSLILLVLGMSVLHGTGETLFVLGTGLAHIGLGLGWRSRMREDTRAVLTFTGLGVAFTTLAMALQFEGPVLATVWAVEAVVIMMGATQAGLSKLRKAGFAVFGLSVGLSLIASGFGFAYSPTRPLLSMESLPFLVQIAALAGAAAMMRTRGESEQERMAAGIAASSANLLAVAWLTFELGAFYVASAWSLETLPFTVATVWAVYAAAVGAFGVARGGVWTRPIAAGMFGVSVATSLVGSGLGTYYVPARPLVSIQSLPFLIQIAVLGAAAVAVRRGAAGTSGIASADSTMTIGNLLALLWLSFEVWGLYWNPNYNWSFAGFTFALSLTWTLYACGLMAFGISRRSLRARLLAVVVFGLVILKLVLADVWMLETPLRIAAFMGLGLVLLLCSLSYHRFRELILGPDPTDPVLNPAKAA